MFKQAKERVRGYAEAERADLSACIGALCTFTEVARESIAKVQ